LLSSIFGTVAAVIAGGAVATVTVLGVVTSQTSAPDKSPVNVDSAQIQYGSNG
jgi:hypothetical protein